MGADTHDTFDENDIPVLPMHTARVAPLRQVHALRDAVVLPLVRILQQPQNRRRPIMRSAILRMPQGIPYDAYADWISDLFDQFETPPRPLPQHRMEKDEFTDWLASASPQAIQVLREAMRCDGPNKAG